ncbi:unnamed protein product [Cylindrotheca closterium]|uniref:Raptor N-terminal CASPase-like domain-containing protein n=1 Tax=Cylindrotheca closterium TaxID=2856 RepID=A0AAD2JN34_9STRA|nr:unnamed protein product [Cylindrotheca closterium]
MMSGGRRTRSYGRQRSPSSSSFSSISAEPLLMHTQEIYTNPVPSFLEVKPGLEVVSEKIGMEEADVAGGRGGSQSVLEKVSSFNFGSRFPSQNQLSMHSSASGLSLQNSTFLAPGDINNMSPSQHGNGEGGEQNERWTPSNPQSALSSLALKPNWRLRDRMKTVGVALVLALNVGTDPPDIVKPNPCAKLQCWMDPSSVSRAKAATDIAERLQAQYEKWQQQRSTRNLRYRRLHDPTVEDVRALCLWLRKQTRQERVLFHYNGHGVPRPTPNGEIWVFDKNHTEYIPLSVSDLRQWLGKPTIIILDCSSAGVLLPFLTRPVSENSPPNTPQPGTPTRNPSNSFRDRGHNYNNNNNNNRIDMDTAASNWVKDTIVLCPTSENEGLPMHPDYPADIFTSCLTTPIKIALRWFVRRNQHSMGSIDPESVDSIPGEPNDRKTPMGELNWIFTAVTDSIAWDVLPMPLFQRLFRQDLLLASMFRNFLLADRILRSLNCTPQSYPPLPQGVADHPLWQAWDLACETCLFGLIHDGILQPVVVPRKTQPTHHHQNSSGIPSIPSNHSSPITTPPVVPIAQTTVPQQMMLQPTGQPIVPSMSSASSPFFSEQLRAFEVWLEYASIHKDRLEELDSPEQLPVLLQVMLSQVYRTRALELLRRFLALGPWAVNLALSLGIFPYVMKLLTSSEYKSLLVDIWASILLFDPSCKADLVKDGAIPHFIQPLTAWSEDDPAASAKQRTFAAFLLAATCHEHPKAQLECMRQNLHGHCCSLISNYVKLKEQIDDNGYDTLNSQLMPSANREWICTCMGNMIQGNPIAQQEAYKSNMHSCLISRLEDDDAASVRAACAFALGCLFDYSSDAAPTAPPPMNLGPSGLPPPTFKPQNAGMMQQQMMQQQQQQLLSPQQGFGQQRMPGGISTIPSGLTSSSALSAGLQGRQYQQQTHQPGAISNQLQPQQRQQQPLQPQLQPQIQGLTPQLQPGGQPSMLSPIGATSRGLRLGGQQLSSGVPFLNQQGMFSPQRAGGNVLGASTPFSPDRNTSFIGSQLDNSMQQSLLPQQTTRAVYENRQRTGLDLTVSEALCNALVDGSALVRHEATMALCNFVEKYIEAFLVVAEESVEKSNASETEAQNVTTVPRGFDRVALDRLAVCWKTLKGLQQRETHPNVVKVVMTLMSLVNDQLMDLRMKAKKEQSLEEKLHGIEEEGIGTDIDSIQSSPKMLSPRIGSASSSTSLRRMSPSGIVLNNGLQHSTSSLSGLVNSPDVNSEKSKNEYIFPKSTFYSWKVETFPDNIENAEEKELEDLDPLNPAGALLAYQEQRNFNVLYKARKLAKHFENLRPKKSAKRERGPYIDDMDDSEDEEAEAQDLALKNALRVKESKVFRNKGHTMTSMLKFHSYEDVLMVCDDQDSVSFWDYENGNRALCFNNGNPKNTRMTAAFWINESSRNLFFVGCDDGSARIWDGTLERNGYIASGGPSLLSTFDAAPDIGEGGPGGSGLFCEWQQHSNKLIAGGNSKYIRCWDLETEKCARTLPTNTDACVTTLCTAWDYELEIAASGSMGMGPNTVVAGHSDGSLKLFDIRSPTGALPMDARRRTPRKDKYAEHSSWIVELSLVSYNGRAELVSGSLDGELRTWDLRMKGSLRSFEVQRGMTALSVHKQIPLVAAGSHTKYIKITNLEGDGLQIIRHYDELHKQKLDPISCLAFHKHKMILAAGTTDSLVSIYKPRHTPRI